MSDARQHAHELIDSLPEAQITGLVQFLESIVDPVAAALRNAEFDDEAESEEEKLAVAEARRSLQQRGAIPHGEAMRRVGLE